MSVLVLASLAATTYVKIFFNDLEIRVGRPNTPDLIMSVLLVILALEACRESFGKTIPLLALFFIGYLFLGQYLPEPFHHVALKPTKMLSLLGVGFNGVYGIALTVSANYLFLFILLGGIKSIPSETEIPFLQGTSSLDMDHTPKREDQFSRRRGVL